MDLLERLSHMTQITNIQRDRCLRQSRFGDFIMHEKLKTHLY